MTLLMVTLKSQSSKLHQNNIKLVIIGDRSRFSPALQSKIKGVEELTRNNTGLTVVIAANYGGQWDIKQAAEQLIQHAVDNNCSTAELELDDFLTTKGMPNPDLFIRTGGEKRISNFLLWQMAYSELYFTDVLWPDFDEDELDIAIKCYSSRQRRFGKTGQQVDEQAL